MKLFGLILSIVSLMFLSCASEVVENVKIKEELGLFNVRVRGNRITFDSLLGVLYKSDITSRDTSGFYIGGTYEMSYTGDEWYVFRYGWQKQDSLGTVFSQVNWLGSTPIIDGGVAARFRRVETIIDTSGYIPVCTIGDSQTWYSEGRWYRKLWKDKDSSMKFIGTRVDVFGFQHEGEGGNNSSEVIERLNYIPSSDNYVLLIGTNDVGITANETITNIKDIVIGLKMKRENCIVYLLTIVPSNLENRVVRVPEINSLILEENWGRGVKVVDVYTEMIKETNWEEEYLLSDKLHLNKKGYSFLVGLIDSQFEK